MFWAKGRVFWTPWALRVNWSMALIFFSLLFGGRQGNPPKTRIFYSWPINSTYEEQSRKGPRDNLDLSQKSGKPPGLEPPGLASLNLNHTSRDLKVSRCDSTVSPTVENRNMPILNEFFLWPPTRKGNISYLSTDRVRFWLSPSTIWIGCQYGLDWFRLRFHHPLRRKRAKQSSHSALESAIWAALDIDLGEILASWDARFEITSVWTYLLTMRHKNNTYPQKFYPNYFEITVARCELFRINFKKLPDTHCICVSCMTLPA